MHYPTDLTDDQWQGIKPLLLSLGRAGKYSRRDLFNAVLYLVKTGCQWRLLPKHYPPWQTVYYHFQCLHRSGRLKKLLAVLVSHSRVHIKRRAPLPSAAIMDAQSVKSTLVSCSALSGYDGGKKIKGIKRHIAVDTLGNLLEVCVHSASVADRKGGSWVLSRLRESYPAVKNIFCDGGYALVGKAADGNQTLEGYPLQIVRPVQLKKGFNVAPRRWVVERSFAWMDTNRRNAKNYERKSITTEAITQLSAIRILLNQLTRYF